ncbi:MAG: hypothetical protein JXR31_04075, partial [Prolixibacteraceae bacterium]|nr:hypothetical protein [Prolixibacteraceae bacterium]
MLDIFRRKKRFGKPRHINTFILIQGIILFLVMSSCESDPNGSKWIEDSSSISQYLETNKEEFSK